MESGEYIQGMHHLHYKDKFCCLGVFCEIGIKNSINIDVHKEHEDCGILYDNSKTCINNKKLLNAMAEFNIDPRELMQMNDEYCQSFQEIAKFIRGKVNE